MMTEKNTILPIDVEPDRFSRQDLNSLPPTSHLDTSDGLRRLGNNQELYLMLLGDFISGYAELPAHLRRELKSEQWQEAIHRVHAIRGVAGNLGAQELAAAAAVFEEEARRALGSDNFSALEEPLRQFITCHEQLIAAISDLLARQTAPAPANQEGPGKEKEPVVEHRPVLLLVDDEVMNTDILTEALDKAYTVHIATDGATALNQAKELLPDLILLDVVMPGMDGFEVCRRLNNDPDLQDIPVIFLTALNQTIDKISGFSCGGVDYVTKPFQLEEIHARVGTHLELRRQKRELQKSYDKLRELETLRDSLVHMIVHDMRSPLSAILGTLQLAAFKQPPQGVADCIERALNTTEALITMVSTLLDISKMEAGQMQLELSEVDLRDLAADTIRMVEPLQGQRRITITADGGMGTFAGDRQVLQRILQNLIGNALKFTDKDRGIITIGIEVISDDQVRLSVKDNGRGIPLEYRGKVFDKFCQVEARKQGQEYSTGLGLAFCKLAVEAHGGRIGVESEKGGGSTFWFALPTGSAKQG